MSTLSQKSDENYQAIEVLCKEKLYVPIIHCAYYSCLQLIIHYTFEYAGITEEEANRITNSQGSHNYYLNKFVKEIKSLDSRNAGQFHRYFNQFKRKRTEADYSKKEIDEKDIQNAKEKVERIRKFLKIIEQDGKCKNIYNL